MNEYYHLAINPLNSNNYILMQSILMSYISDQNDHAIFFAMKFYEKYLTVLNDV